MTRAEGPGYGRRAKPLGAMRVPCGMMLRFCRRVVLGSGVAVLVFSAAGGLAAQGIGNAPTVAPAPMVDQPLAPVANDTPDERPSDQHVWVPGHWRWSEGAYVWESGRWTVPPAAGAIWQGPEWQRQTNGYVLKEGNWLAGNVSAPAPAAVTSPAPAVGQVVRAAPTSPTQVVVAAPTRPAPDVVVVMAPPAPRREVVLVRPSPRHVWVPGYWSWRGGRHVWIAGHYTLPPRGYVAWVEPRWERRGGGYFFVEGSWRR